MGSAIENFASLSAIAYELTSGSEPLLQSIPPLLSCLIRSPSSMQPLTNSSSSNSPSPFISSSRKILLARSPAESCLEITPHYKDRQDTVCAPGVFNLDQKFHGLSHFWGLYIHETVQNQPRKTSVMGFPFKVQLKNTF